MPSPGKGLLLDQSDVQSKFNKSSWQLLNLSLQRESNISSKILHMDVWTENEQMFNDVGIDHLLNSTNVLLNNADSSAMQMWKSSLSEFDLKSIFDITIPKCVDCTSEHKLIGLEEFQKNECKCNLGVKISPNTTRGDNLTANISLTKTTSYDGSSQELKLVEDQRLFKPRFGRPQPRNITRPATTKSIQEVDLTTEEDENKAHKSNVAKITFKTAKEQLLASNPAAKRTLGASRKAQAKFVSPMIGVQEKQETAESQIADTVDEALKHIDPKMIELIESEIIDKGTPIGWEDIAGLEAAKSVLQETVVWPALRPDLFTGLRRPPRGLLLFGPPGTGKTLIGKCVASQCQATFFSISASSLTSKWIGDGEKMVRALFAVARHHQPSVIFIDEIDSLLTQRSDTEHEATRRIKTEFLVQFDGAATDDEDRLLVVGATNRPHELDEAARRRLVKRLYIPLPDAEAREQMILKLLATERHVLSAAQVAGVARRAGGYSGADVRALCAEAALGPVRAVPPAHISTIRQDMVRPVCMEDFINALERVKPSVSPDDLGQYVKWNKTFGQGF